MLDEVVTAKLCACIEQEVDVNRYHFQGIHLWPTFRIHLLGIMAGQYKEEFETQDGYLSLRAAIQDRFDHVMRAAGLPRPDQPADCFRAARTDAMVSEKRKSRGNVLIFCNPDDYSADSTGIHGSVFMEPLVENIRKKHNLIHLELADHPAFPKMPRRYSTVFLPAVSAKDMKEYNNYITIEDRNSIIDLSNSVNDYIQSNFNIKFRSLSEYMEKNIVYLFATKKKFDRFLDLHRPDAVFLICYYYAIGMSLLWSCRERGIPTVEVQHGINGDYHVAYSQWTVAPAEGYALWPQIFLTWGTHSANNIARWQARATAHHRVIIGGCAAPPTVAGSADPELSALTVRYRKRVLVTLQPFSVATGLSPFLLETIQAAPPDWLWLLRCHPLSATDGIRNRFPSEVHRSFVPDGIRAILDQHGILNAEVDRTSARPLREVLAQVDHHVTNHSSTVLEAMAEGIPTTFIHPLARHFFEGILSRREASYAEDAQALVASIERGWEGLSKPDPRDITVHDPAWLNEFIDTLIP